VVFGDVIEISPGKLALQAAGLLALVVGVIMVARAPVLSHLRSGTALPVPGRTPPGTPHEDGGSPPGQQPTTSIVESVAARQPTPSGPHSIRAR
jgi:hypothetical protein